MVEVAEIFRLHGPEYLAPYVFRVAISNSRILKLEDGRVTFKYKDSATDQVKFATVSAEEFMRDEVDGAIERERSGAALMITCESSTKSGS